MEMSRLTYFPNLSVDGRGGVWELFKTVIVPQSREADLLFKGVISRMAKLITRIV